jgi:biotin carboxylase
MKKILITGIGGLTPRSIATIIRKNHPDYKIIGCDINKKAVGFFMNDLVDKYYICPKCTSPDYFEWMNKLVKKEQIDYAFVQPEAEIVAWADYYEKNNRYPCPTFIGCKSLSESLRDKSIMADLLKGTKFIPKTIKVTQNNPRYEEVKKDIGFPCWIRATEGTGGLGSLRLDDISSYKSWLFINSEILEFTVSEFLTGRHLANQMLYYNGEYIKGAALECVEYVMANTAPSHVTGNTHFGRFLNEDKINMFCDECIKYLESKLGVKAHGILSFDLKEDKNGELKVTEVNIRHMAYTGIMSKIGFDLTEDTIRIMEDGNCNNIERVPFYHYDKPYIFLRDVDIEPIILESEKVFNDDKAILK